MENYSCLLYTSGTEADTRDELFESEKKDIGYIDNSANKVAGAAFTAKAVLVQITDCIAYYRNTGR